MKVFLGARGPKKAESAAQKLSGEGLDVVPRAVDVSEDESVGGLADELEELGEAGRASRQRRHQLRLRTVDEQRESRDGSRDREDEPLRRLGRLQALLPLLRASEHGRIVNVSSEAGSSFTSLGGMASVGGVLPAYTVSKAVLNAFTVTLAADLKDTGILVNAVCPGLVATSPEAEAAGGRSASEGAASAMWAATRADDVPTGGYFRDGKPLPR